MTDEGDGPGGVPTAPTPPLAGPGARSARVSKKDDRVPPGRPLTGGWLLVATWFGAGLAPRAPGTVGTAASLFLWAPLVLFDVPWWMRLFLALFIFVVGIPAAARAVEATGRQDPQHVVVDEVAGMGMTLVLAGPHWGSVVLGFLLFRLCDIAKPWPISIVDDRVRGGLGAMADDLLAGMLALCALELVEEVALPSLGLALGGPG